MISGFQSDDNAMISAADFLREYFHSTKGQVYLGAIRNAKSALSSGEIAHIRTRKSTEVNKFVSSYNKPENECAIYFCTATIQDGHTTRDAGDCWQFPSLFADCDDHNHDLDRARVIELLEGAECPPTLIINSGHGLQPHWLLNEPSEDADRIIAARKKLQAILASDAVHDAPRFMRLVGTHNSKNGDWLPVEVASHHSERRYTLKEMEEWLDTAEVIIPRKVKEKTKGNGADKPFVVPPSAGPATDHKRGAAWARKALAESAHELANATEGSRHKTLLNKSIRMATMMARGWIDAVEVRRVFLAAAETNGQIRDYGIKHFDDTFTDGLKYGLVMPHDDLPNDDEHQESISSSDDHQESASASSANNKSAHTDLPQLLINDSNPTATAKELAKLIAAHGEFLFNGNAPVRVAVETDSMPRALEVTTESVRILAHEICNPIRRVKQTDIPVALKTDIALLYLNGLEGRWGLKPFRGIATAPILSNDGNICIASGYDAASGLWCHDIPALDIPEQPSEREAKAALERLRLAFRTFPFADSKRIDDPALGVQVADLSKPAGLDESTFIAALLTGVCRQSLELAPGFLCDAPSLSGAGCGKGLLVKAICIIASGVRPAAFTSGHDAGEFDKRLSAALVEAHPAVFLDNFNAKELRSDILASVLTESPAKVRIMGQTRMVPLHVRTFIGITGNGIEIAEDMARRIIKSHLDAKMENPEERKFRPGFLEDILAHRAGLLSDALIIWRWGRQNESALTAGRALGSYEVWCQWVRDPLLALGMKDPVDRLTEIKASDPRRRALVGIFEVWWEKHKDKQVKAKDLDPDVLALIDEKSSRHEDGSLRYSRQRVARFLSKHANTRLSGYILEATEDGPDSKKIAQYSLKYEPKNNN
jgi:hypothetical protein